MVVVNGLRMVRFSMVWPLWRSSEIKKLQPDCRAAATIRASHHEVCIEDSGRWSVVGGRRSDVGGGSFLSLLAGEGAGSDGVRRLRGFEDSGSGAIG